MAGRKVFTSGEILTSADVNSFLMDQSVMVFADSTARSSAIPTPTEGMVTYREDANRVEVFDGSAFGAIGGILQVVSTTKTDAFSVSSATYTDITGLSASITPASTSSKILVVYSVFLGQAPNSFPNVRLLRDSTDIAIGDASGVLDRVTLSSWTGGSNNSQTVPAGNFLDSPNTTSATTYKFQIRTSGSLEAQYVNRNARDSTIDDPRGVSTITLLEVAV